MRQIIAIDPGKIGGIAAIHSDGKVEVHNIPGTNHDLIGLVDSIRRTGGDWGFWLEQVGGFVGKKQPGSRMFNFGRGFGNIEMMCIMFGLWFECPLNLVRPQKWIKGLGLGVKGSMSNTAWKNKLKAEAQRLYPQLGITLKTSDAVLIMEYARRQERG